MEQSSIPHWRQQSVPHSGLREALLAPMAAPSLPDVARSFFLRMGRERRKLRTPWSRALHPRMKLRALTQLRLQSPNPDPNTIPIMAG